MPRTAPFPTLGSPVVPGLWRPAFARWLAVWLLLVPLAAGLRADGIVLPPVAAPAVTMPDQRALLVWHEQEQSETLVIESRFAGRGRDFAWVVPLPSKPEITPATRGTLPTLEALFKPVLVGAGEWDVFLPWLVAVFTLFCLPLFIKIEVGETASRRFVELLTLFAIFVVLYGIIFPTVGSSGTGAAVATENVLVERGVIGDYDVAVLSGESADGIGQWLRENKFALPVAAEPVVAEHAHAGGYFAAVRLRRTEDTAEPVAPAPLVFTFKTQRPVYPMRLTGTGASKPLEVELFVFGEARAEVDGLKATAYAPVKIVPDAGLDLGWPRVRYSAPEAVMLSHEALRRLCAGTTVVTRLEGTLAPTQMRQDLFLRWQPYRSLKWDTRFASATAVWCGALVGVLSISFMVERLRWKGQPVPPSRPTAFRVLLTAGLLGLMTWIALPTVPVISGSENRRAVLRQFHFRDKMMVAFHSRVEALKSEERILPRIREEFQQALIQAKADAEITLPVPLPREGDAPGEYSFRQLLDGTWRLVWITENAQEVYWPYAEVKSGAAP